MRDKSEQKVIFDPELTDRLACPACREDLRLNGERLVCGGCGRCFPVIDGIPVLIAERGDAGS